MGKNFALELTYNYGIKGYERGNDLRFIGLHLTKNGFKAAQEMGYQPKKCDDTNIFYDIVGPDGIKYRCKLSESLDNIKEPFWSISLNVSDIDKSFEFWCGRLKMHSLSFVKGKYLRAAFGGSVPLEFYQIPNNVKSVDHKGAAGRIAFSTSIEKGPYLIHDFMNRYDAKTIMVKPVTLPTPNKADVDVVILQDPTDKYEICFVNKNGFDDLCTTKPGDDKIDWNTRKEKGADQDKGRVIKK